MLFVWFPGNELSSTKRNLFFWQKSKIKYYKKYSSLCESCKEEAVIYSRLSMINIFRNIIICTWMNTRLKRFINPCFLNDRIFFFVIWFGKRTSRYFLFFFNISCFPVSAVPMYWVICCQVLGLNSFEFTTVYCLMSLINWEFHLVFHLLVLPLYFP